MGSFAGYQPNAAAMIGVIAKHRAAVGNIENTSSVPEDLLSACRQSWDDALDLGEVSGYRNAQATVLAPTGTISFMMDCDTTGVEPDFSLVESKKLGVKAIAIYRDNCKVAQPLSGKSEKAEVASPPVPLTQRRRLPEDRVEVGRKFQVGEYEGYIHVGLYEDGTPGDIFCDVAKVGTTLQGLMNSLMISVSLGLQYGVPPEVYVSKFAHMRFEPAGQTNDPDIRVAKSIVDYIFRWMGKRFLTADQQEEIGIMSAEVRARLAQSYANGM